MRFPFSPLTMQEQAKIRQIPDADAPAPSPHRQRRGRRIFQATSTSVAASEFRRPPAGPAGAAVPRCAARVRTMTTGPRGDAPHRGARGRNGRKSTPTPGRSTVPRAFSAALARPDGTVRTSRARAARTSWKKAASVRRQRGDADTDWTLADVGPSAPHGRLSPGRPGAEQIVANLRACVASLL
jgi:hypothetical protein